MLFASLPGFANDYNIEYLTTGQGLSQNEVTSILQDKNGFMWFGTRGGLNRYDAYEFIHHKPKANQLNYLSNPSIESMFEDSNGNIWVGTKSGGLNRYNSETEQFSHINSFGKADEKIVGNRIICITESPKGNILFGTWSEGLYILDFEKDSLIHLFPHKQVNHLLVQDAHKAWVATNSGLFLLDLTTCSYERIDFGEDLNITEFIFDKNKKNLWLVGWDCGLILYDIETGTWQKYPLNNAVNPRSTGSNNTYTILQGSDNQLWIGTWNYGLFTFDRINKTFEKVELAPNRNRTFNKAYDIILDIYEDKDQNIWIGTDAGGIVKLGAKKSFNSISMEENPGCGLTNFHIFSFWKSKPGVLYLGTRGGGLFKTTDNKKITPIVAEDAVPGLASMVKYIFPYSENILWVSYNDRCYELNLLDETGRLTPVKDSVIAKLRKITSIHRFDKSLLVGTQQNGLYFFPDINNTRQFEKYMPQNFPVLQNERITFIKEDDKKNIWIGTFKGVYFFDKKTHEISPIKLVNGQYLTGDIINCWHQTNDSIFWLGTPSGLNKLTKGKDSVFSVQHFNPEAGLIDNYILGILSAKDDEIWVSTSSGILKLLIDEEKFYSFDISDGLPSLNFSESMGYLAEDSTMYFATTNGYIYFKGRDIKINKTIPPVVFTRFKIFNGEIKPGDSIMGKVLLDKSINLKPKIHLSHKEKEFTIEFSALNYNSPQRNQYSYKLEGYDSEWVKAGTRRSVTYINLNPGEYQFRVRASNNNLVWNDEGASLAIVIGTAPWKSWYAILLYVFLITCVVLLIRWNAIKQVLLANNLEMEKVKHQQEQHLNEIKLRFFTDISHEFRTPLTLILGPIKEVLDENPESRRLKVVYKNAKRLMALVNQLLEFRRLEADTLGLRVSNNNIVDFIKEVCISFEELAKINHIQFTYNLPYRSKQLWFDVEKMEMVLNNLISNAFKYIGSGSEVEVALSETDGYVCMHVIDNGAGIREEDIKFIFNRFYQSRKNGKSDSTGIGLNLVKRLVELHKGEISVESVPNVRTEFIVKLRKGEAHFADEDKIETAFVPPSGPEKTGVAAPLKPETHRVASGEKKNSILIVEDHFEIRRYLEELLEYEYQVDTAENGIVGYQKALEKEYDLILSDVIMPEMDGIELCKKLKSNIETSHIPVVLLTAKSASQFRLEGLNHGAEAYITKPFNSDELKVQITTLLNARQKLKERYGKIITLEPGEIEITSREEEFMERVVQSVEANIENSEFRSDDLAALVGTSTTTLYRKLKSLTGHSSNEIIRSIRLKRAAQLLRNSENTVSEIAYSVGFNDVKYFRKCFFMQFSVTPSEYRKTQ